MYWWSFWFFKRLIVAERLDSFKEVFLVLCFTQVMALCVSHGHLHDCYFSCCCHISCNCKLKRTEKITAISSLYPEMELSTGTLAWYKYVRKPFSIVLWKPVRRPQWSIVHLSWMKPRETVQTVGNLPSEELIFFQDQC